MAHTCVKGSVVRCGRSLLRFRSLEVHSSSMFWSTGHRHSHCDSTSGSIEKKVLTLSSLIRQDGLDIQELPIIIKRASQTFTPYSTVLPSVDNVRKQTEQDESFKLNLQSCTTVKQVFKLLEVPSDQVTGHSAAFALHRICQLRVTSFAWDGDGIDSFIRTAVLNELYDTVIRDVQHLENETLITLTKCYLASDSFKQHCTSSINLEIENRLGDGLFDISDLCQLSSLLSRHKTSDKDIVDKIWAHIGMQTSELNESNICDVYRSVPTRHKYLVKILDKKLLKCWWKLTAEDVSNIVPCLVRLKSENRLVMTSFGKWVFMNFNTLSDSQLTHILAGFVHSNFYDQHLLKALDRYVPAKGPKLDTDLLMLVVEYYRSCRFLSPCVMDAAAKHFVANSNDYKPAQACTVLRAFGYLNYLPTNSTSLFLKIEDYIDKNFSRFTIPHLTELLCSFTFIERYPLNFVDKIFSNSFLSRAHNLNEDSVKEKTGKCLEMFQSSVMLECKSKVSNLYKLWAPLKHCWMDDRHHMIHTQVYKSLKKLLGEDVVVRARLSKRSAYFIDFAIWCHSDGTLIENDLADSMNYLYPYKYAILIQMPESYCVNTGHLLGEFAMRNRHLKLLEYQVIEIPYQEVQKLSEDNREKYLLKKLPNKLSKHLTTSRK